MSQKGSIHIKTDHAPGRANPLAQQTSYPAWPAANVDTRPTLAHTDQIEHALGIRRHSGALDMQTLNFPAARLDRVAARESFHHRRLSFLSGPLPSKFRFTPNSDCESGLPRKPMSALLPKTGMCRAKADVC